MKSAYFGFVILSFLMIFTTGFAYGASYHGIDGFSGGTVQNDELKIVKQKSGPKFVCASKSISSSYDQSEVTVSFYARELASNGKRPVVMIDSDTHYEKVGNRTVESIVNSNNFSVKLCLKQNVGGSDPRVIFYSNVRIDVSEYIPPQSPSSSSSPSPSPSSSPSPSPSPSPAPERDSDRDGFPDSRDRCPQEYSTTNNGCPTYPDRDGDGIRDSLDKCMNNPETFNGYQDSDGCPDTPPSQTQTQFDDLIGPIVGIIIASIIGGIIVAIVKKKQPKEIAESIIIHYACPVCSAKLSEPNLESKQNCENCGWSS